MIDDDYECYYRSTRNPYVDPVERWWKCAHEEEEKNKMKRFTTNQLNRLHCAVRSFAQRKGVTAETEYDTSRCDIARIVFRKNDGRVSKTYEIHADEVVDIKKGLDVIFADVTRYFKLDETPIKPSVTYPGIKKVIFSNPCTIVLWDDGTKTVVRCTNEEFDPEKGLAMAIAKKTLGNNGSYFDVFKKWIKEEHND
jgi:hypothetical protein